jgi:hypothetical protein
MPIIATRASAAYGAGFAAVTTIPYQGPFGAYDALATTTLSTPTASVTFSGIPSGYKHLQLRFISRDVASATYFQVSFNGDTSSSNYTWHTLEGNGTSASANGVATGSFPGAVVNQAGGSGTGIFSASIIDILDYANTSKNKTVRSLCGFDANGTGAVALQSNLWINTAAITSISFLYNGSPNIDEKSTFALYGVK